MQRPIFSHPIVKRSAIALAFLIFFCTLAMGIWIYRLDQSIKVRFAEKRFAPPVEFYSAPETIRIGAIYPSGFFESHFSKMNYRRRNFGQPIQAGDFSVWSAEQCREVVAIQETDQLLARCFVFRNLGPVESAAGAEKDSIRDSVQILGISDTGQILGLFNGPEAKPTDLVFLEPVLFAQYYGANPVLRKVVTLASAPTMCLNSLLAIEDSQFLEHPGISFTGLARALITNLRSGRKAQGGSTITQQLVKNYFLTDEKTIRRKFTEMIMAFLVERHASKDEILETYINLIYMGQNGPYEVRGFAAASEHYFGKNLNDLNLEQCALLAAVLNSPGLYNPFKNPERALKRRDLVIDRMLELSMIDADAAATAKSTPLPTKAMRFLTEPAPYFVQAVRRELEKQGFDESDGLRVFTTLNIQAQEAAQQAVRAGLTRLEESYPRLKKLKASGKNLEAVLISADPHSGAIEALVGGRGFLATQFNRAVESRRQVGSVMKPFVYLTAMEGLDPEGKPYSPLSPIQDDPTTHSFEGQKWTPRNYDEKYRGKIPLFWALKESLNASTVNLGMAVGLDNIIDTSNRVGIRSKVKPLPSLTLGAFELTPLEVLQGYSTLANLGTKVPLRFIYKVEDLNGHQLDRFTADEEIVVAADSSAVLVGMMKQTLINGTGRGVKLSGFSHPAAGKTGTTNDKKDAWFAGFTPHHSAVVWVGYDDNTSHGLTGASGAVPIWTAYMKDYASHLPSDDFAWPESVEVSRLTPAQQFEYGVPANEELEEIELVFRKGQAPKGILENLLNLGN